MESYIGLPDIDKEAVDLGRIPMLGKLGTVNVCFAIHFCHTAEGERVRDVS
jgi:hypothetical protein